MAWIFIKMRDFQELKVKNKSVSRGTLCPSHLQWCDPFCTDLDLDLQQKVFCSDFSLVLHRYCVLSSQPGRAPTELACVCPALLS